MDLFINLIQNNPIVYDKTLKDFKNTRKKEEAWVNIARQSRMEVGDAKKRYFSLQQKYCREKRNSEVKRRNKVVNRKNWVFYDRLQFLDAFIQPRATFTNDTGYFEDLDPDQELIDEGGCGEDENERFYEGNDDGSQVIEIELDKNVNANDIHQFLDHSQGNEPADSNNYVDEIRSDYTGEVSQILYFSIPNEESVSDNTTTVQTVQTEKQQHQIEEQFDPDYSSQYPSTSSSHTNLVKHNESNQPLDQPPAVPRTITTKSNFTSSDTLPLLQKQIPLRRDASAPKIAASRQFIPASKDTTTQNASKSSFKSNRPVVQPSSLLTASTSKDQNIEVIRYKMDSCLNAIQNKMTDKVQRSPHAPFLAYLGTKLPNVPKEILAQVEEEILEIVKYHS